MTTYAYDFENRLIGVILPDQTTNEFTYDGDKRRTSKKNAAGEVTKFLYDGINILKDFAGDGSETASYVQGIGIDKLISVLHAPSSELSYYHSDALGSVRSLTNTAGAVQASYTYDAWGNITNQTGSSENEYKFTSRRWEEEIGLQYNRARFYDPETGRFTTPDPLTGGPDDPTVSYFNGIYSIFHRFIKEHVDSLQPDKHNRYVYCYNNPVNLIDPLGLQASEAIADSLADFARQRISDPDLGPYEYFDWVIAVAAFTAAAIISGDLDLEAPESTLPPQTVEVGGGEGIPWSQESAEALTEVLEASGELFDWMSVSSEETQPGEVQEKAKTEEAAGEKGAEVEVEEEKASAEAAQTRDVIDFDEKGQVRKRTETTYTETREPWSPPVDKPPPKYPVTKALIDFAAEVLGNLLK